MIKFRNPEEQASLIYYAQLLKNHAAENILINGGIETKSDAHILAKFFWKMVDQTVIDAELNKTVAGYENLEALCEDTMRSLRSHFFSTGFIEIWDEESDNA